MVMVNRQTMLRDFINGLRREMKGENGFKIFSMVCLALETGSTSILTRWPRLLMRFFLTKWVVQGAVNVDIGANPSAEGGEDDEGVDDQAVKVVDIVDTFRLQRNQLLIRRKLLLTLRDILIKLLTPKLMAEKQELFTKNTEGATKFLLSKLKDFQFFVGESMHDDGSLVFAYYKEGATDPTFIYFAYGLKEIKC